MASGTSSGKASEKPTLSAYPAWLESAHQVKIKEEQTRYTATGDAAKRVIEQSEFWQAYKRQRRELDDQYQISSRGYLLFASAEDDHLHIKSWSSFIEKSWRKNIVNNPNWPEAPEGDWVLPDRWYELTNDIIRTTLVVKYLDGVEVLLNGLRDIASDCGRAFESSLEARDEGYYAAHSYTYHDVPVPQKDWDVVDKSLRFEVQITTQLQEVIRRLTHEEYDKRRKSIPDATKKWQWDYSGESFTPNYLGHILHYMEGLIMEVRNRDDGR